MITDFITESKKRPETYNNHTKGMPNPPDTKDLNRLLAKKRSDLHKTQRSLLSPTITYGLFIEKNHIDCGVKNFLSILEEMLDDNSLVFKHVDILQELSDGLHNCGAPCPCPAELKND